MIKDKKSENILQKSVNQLPIIDSKFRAIEILNQGKHSIIYKAIPLSNPQKILAIKVFALKKSKSPLYKKSFTDLIKGEFYLFKKLDSIFFPKVYEIGFDDKLLSIYYTMEVLDNCQTIFSFYKKLLKVDKKKVLNKEIFATVTYKIILALTHLHSIDFIHYNITPKNILLYFPDDKELEIPEIKIISLSLAERNKIHKKIKYRRNLYLSPEIILNEENIDYRSDYYSFGITMLHSLLVDSIKDFIPIFLQKAPESLEQNFSNIKKYLGLIKDDLIKSFLEKLTHKNPSKRFQSARDIIISLNRDFNQNFEISKFHSDFLFKQQKDKFIIRNSILHDILSSYKNVISNSAKKGREKKMESNFRIISGRKGSGVSRVIKELDNFFLYLKYDFLTIVPKCGDKFAEITELLNNLLVRFNKNCKTVNRDHLKLIKRLNLFKNEKVEFNTIYNDILDQIKNFIGETKFIIIFSDVHRFNDISLQFINYLRNNIDNSNIFIITSLSYNNSSDKKMIQKKIPFQNNSNTIELKPLEIEELKLLRKQLFGKIINLPNKFDDFVLRSTKGNFKKVIALYNSLYDDDVIYNSFRSYYYNLDNKYVKK